MTPEQLRRAVAELVDAIDEIVANWESGDLAGVVNAAESLADYYRTEDQVHVEVRD